MFCTSLVAINTCFHRFGGLKTLKDFSGRLCLACFYLWGFLRGLSHWMAWFVDNCHGPFIYLQVVEICSLVIFRSLSMQTWDNCNVVIIRKILKVTKHWIWTLLTDILFCFWPHSWSMAFDVPSPYIHLIWPAQGHCVGMVGTSQPT